MAGPVAERAGDVDRGLAETRDLLAERLVGEADYDADPADGGLLGFQLGLGFLVGLLGGAHGRLPVVDAEGGLLRGGGD